MRKVKKICNKLLFLVCGFGKKPELRTSLFLFDNEVASSDRSCLCYNLRSTKLSMKSAGEDDGFLTNLIREDTMIVREVSQKEILGIEHNWRMTM